MNRFEEEPQFTEREVTEVIKNLSKEDLLELHRDLTNTQEDLTSLLKEVEAEIELRSYEDGNW